MKQICLGTMVTLIYQSRRRNADKIKDICGGIFSAYGLDINNYNSGLPSHLKSGHDPVPGDLIAAARNMSIEEVAEGVEDYLLPLIHSAKHESLFRAIKAVLREDTTIADRTVVGLTPGYEKENILKHDSFHEAETLANIITYSIVSIENDKLKASIREISTDFVESYLHSDEGIYFISPQMDQDQISPLKRTLKDPMFDRIFLKATDFTVAGLDNPSRACVFYIDPSNCKFRFRQMKEFIVNNIGSYVFSRAQVKRLVDRTKNPAAVGAQAMLKFIRTYGANAETVLGEILLYVFMEQELDAPKIMSKIEIDEFNRNAVSKSDGVHLLSLDKSGQPFHQLVFGAADIVGNLQAAIDRAFEKIIQIEANSEIELRMVDNTTQWTIYDPDATKYMVELMTPQRNGTYKPDMAFGAFLGYTVKLDKPEPDSQKYRTAVKEQLKKDIVDAQEHIIKKIQENGLSGYCFYFYTFPFNDAPNEKVSIIQELLSGGGIV